MLDRREGTAAVQFNEHSVSVAMTQSIQAGSVPYSALWGTHLAMTVAFVGTMAGLWLRLRLPIMRSLALHWGARLVIVALNLLYLTSPEPRHWSLVPFAALFGTACGALYITARDAVAHAAPESPAVVGARSLLIGTTLIALVIHLLNSNAAPFSPGLAALWTQLMFGVAYGAFLTLLALRWLDYPAARHRLVPLIAGVALAMGFEAFDAAQRMVVLTGGDPFGGPLVTLTSSLAGTLCLGVGSLLSALESERDTLRLHADRLRSAQVDKAEALRLQSLGRLASGVAHDFNNVLGLIGNGIDFVEESLRAEPSEVRRDLRNMRVAVDRGVGLTRRLISFSRAQVATPECFAPATVLRENLAMLQRLLSSGIALKAHVAGRQEIEMDRAAFEQVVINLLVNARDASAPDGSVRLLLDDERVEQEHQASVGRVGPGEWVRLSIIDDGVGIAPHILPNLFEPFFTTKGDAGTGLGLATVAAAVHDVHGAVDVYSTPGHGTRFDVWLPVHIARSSPASSGKALHDAAEVPVQNAK